MITGEFSYATTFGFLVYCWCYGPMPVLTSAHGSNVLLVASRHSARGSGVWGANQKNVSLDRVPLAPQYPFERPAGGVLQVPERLKEYLKFGGFASPKTPPHGPLLPRRGGRPRAAPRKGFLNRRFKPAFAYFSRARKVGQGSGGGQPTGYQ